MILLRYFLNLLTRKVPFKFQILECNRMGSSAMFSTTLLHNRSTCTNSESKFYVLQIYHLNVVINNKYVFDFVFDKNSFKNLAGPKISAS